MGTLNHLRWNGPKEKKKESLKGENTSTTGLSKEAGRIRFIDLLFSRRMKGPCGKEDRSQPKLGK